GWGWAIDNLRIQYPVSSPAPVLSPGNIAAYPNPFNNSFTVRVEPKEEIENLSIDIYNIFGQKVKSISRHHITGIFSEEIFIGEEVSGMYLLSVKENGQQILTKKMIKN
ncbi:MAG: T9SS type A sorting domain-containing protein, partial [Tangfeifania sp.]